MTAERTIENRVIEVAARVFHKDVDQLTRDTRFVQDLYAKSLNIIEFIAVLEDEFDIDIPSAEARKRKTIGEAVDLIESLYKK
jgi:acyl carrier protein